ncbi:glutaminyl-peptide cyclotransferase [Carboxylicivirga taeanensis]|uniref:glutaminyl-peptide cyclotransferase n=1 Tax=Carboxylicivirga taeanensis TaxID=1416875 RepID=UPI003F6DF59B
MSKHHVAILCMLLLTGCGVYLQYPGVGNNSQWKLMTDSDTAVFCLSNASRQIDSIIDNTSKKVYVPLQTSCFELPGNRLRPGINELSFTFYSGNRKYRLLEKIYMVSDTEPHQVTLDNYHIIKHDADAFTQGLLWHNGVLYESTGLTGQSSLRIINPDNGQVVQKLDLDKQIFAEGLTLADSTLIMLTWKDGLVYTFNQQLEQLAIYPYKQEGWGLTTVDGRFLLSSNGTNKLHYLSNDFKVDSVFQVYNNTGPVQYLNELEYIEGKVWANVLGSDRIVVIDPASGKVEVTLDLSHCIDRSRYTDAGVLNGIAYNPREQLVYLTGKNWPYIIVWQHLSFEK